MEDFQLGMDDFEKPQYQSNKFDEKELEKRKKIADDIKNTGIIEDADLLYKMSKIKSKFVAFEYRVPLTDEEHDNLTDTLRFMNRHIKDALAILDSYITFSHENPSTENMINAIYNLSKFLSDEASTPFHLARYEDEKIHYFTYKWFTKYLNSVLYLVERLQGLLIRAGKYILDAENESRQGNGYNYGGGFGGGYGGGYGGGGFRDYNYPSTLNEYRFGMKHPTYNAKFNVPKKRDFGDEADTHEIEKNNGEN